MSLPAPPAFRQSLEAILLASSGWFLYCICDAISKYLSSSYSPFQILAFSGGIGASIAGGYIVRHYGIDGFKTPKWKWYLARSLAQAVSSYCTIMALSNIPMSDFYGIVFLTPMATALLAAFVLKESIGLFRIGAIGFGFIGVLIIVGPSFASHNVGYLYALGSVVCATMSAITIRKIGPDPIPARFVFFPFFASALIYIPAMLMTGFKIPVAPLDMSLLLLFSPLAMFGLLLWSAGFARARETAVVAPFHYTQMVWGSLLGYFVFGNIPALTTFIGSVIIVAAGILIIWREHKHHVQIASLAAETPL
ncbi:MAG: putative rane protein [Micavibrio sp.]|nr:putative rane protein [Micavibrio sp.]